MEEEVTNTIKFDKKKKIEFINKLQSIIQEDE